MTKHHWAGEYRLHKDGAAAPRRPAVEATALFPENLQESRREGTMAKRYGFRRS